MDSTVVVAAMGYVATLLGAWLTVRMQLRGDRSGRLLDAKVRIYGECADALYEFERATYNRVKHRLDNSPDDQREPMRQEAYRGNARARSAIGQVAILTGDETLRGQLEEARRSVGGLNDATSHMDLQARRQAIDTTLTSALDLARHDLMG